MDNRRYGAGLRGRTKIRNENKIESKYMQNNATVENQRILKSTEPCLIPEFDTAHACDFTRTRSSKSLSSTSDLSATCAVHQQYLKYTTCFHSRILLCNRLFLGHDLPTEVHRARFSDISWMTFDECVIVIIIVLGLPSSESSILLRRFCVV